MEAAALETLIAKLPPPPRPGSFRDRMDLSDAVARQRDITGKNLTSIQETYLFNVFYFSSALGPNFNPKNFPNPPPSSSS